MIKRIKTDDGERWALVFEKHDSLEDLRNYADGLLEIVITATGSDTWDGKQSYVYWVLNLLQHFIPNVDDAVNVNRLLKEAKKIN